MRLTVFQPDIALNLGAMIRICACFDVPIDIIAPCGFPLSVRALRRSAMDYADIADIHHHDSWRDFHAQRPAGRLILLTTSAKTPLWDYDFRPTDSLMVGRESAGVPPLVAAACEGAVLIPMPGGGRSLNVAVSAGIALAEATRQTRGHKA